MSERDDFTGLMGVSLIDAVIPDPLPREVHAIGGGGVEPLVAVMLANAAGRGVPTTDIPVAIAGPLLAAGLLCVGFGPPPADGFWLTAAGWKTAWTCVTCPVPPPPPPEFFCE